MKTRKKETKKKRIKMKTRRKRIKRKEKDVWFLWRNNSVCVVGTRKPSIAEAFSFAALSSPGLTVWPR